MSSWQEVTIGPCRLICADCRDVIPTLERIDVLLTDPPYGIVNKFGVQHRLDGTRSLEFPWDTPTITQDVVLPAIQALLQQAKSAMVFCGGDQFGEVLQSFRTVGMVAKPAAWVKKCPPPAMPNTWWPSAMELAVYGYRSGAYFGDTNTKRSNVFVEDSYRFGQPGKVDHPTQKPLNLMRKLVAALVEPESVAVDCFMGSGTTLVACAEQGLQCIGIEREQKYYDIAVKRVRAAVRDSKSVLQFD